MLITTKIQNSIPSFCPKCGEKLRHVNAIDTIAKMYLVWCPNLGCRYCKDYYLGENY